MKRRYMNGLIVFCALLFASTPATAVAQEMLLEPALDSTTPVIITEVQTGGTTAGDEFIELYNASATPVDITGWQVRYLNSLGAGDTTVLLASVSAVNGTPVVLTGHSYFVLRSSSVVVPEGIASQIFAPALSKTDKTVALFKRNEPTCQMTVQDAVAWETVAGTTLGEGPGVVVAEPIAAKDKLLQRRQDASGTYLDTNNNAQDFVLLASNPGEDNAWPPAGNDPGSPSLLPAFAASNCIIDPGPPPPAIEDPPIPGDLVHPTLSELLPNPAAPKTDANDEFIELYNPNTEDFDLSGYVLEAGLTTKYRYVFPEGTILTAQAYRAFLSADTHIALSNSGGQVRLFDPSGEVVDQSQPYMAAADDKAWAFIDDAWRWTTTLTPGASNELAQPDPGDPEAPPLPDPDPSLPPPPPNNGLLAPQITELLPNPATPQTDADDEFIELYNPNDGPYALGGYVLEVGLTTKYRYTIPANTTMQPHSYMAFFSADTKLAMANSAGQARLIDPLGAVIVQSDQYATAKDGQAWLLLDNTWQWSAKPTPNALNVPAAPVALAKKVSTTAAKKPKAAKKATKAATTKKPKPVVTGNAGQAAVAVKTPRDPLHPSVLALVAGFAVLYGAYEYRRDMANKFYQFRSNRAARATARQSAKGR